MNQCYDLALAKLAHTAQQLAMNVPAPSKVPFQNSFVFRYQEKTIQQAIVQKLVRAVSTLHATRLLMDKGFFQEQVRSNECLTS
ncbi:hypothetical protein [Polaromonas sp.]|uniref:hypothetical protein n=1 Tax=Polaromonas sp. TaxID=1869339 RepID=UPI0018459AB0|nr:hypothetical protein [Polaromonas sp.]NML84289.1 hypothetical protein [Polaromonas sp.]